jgi:SAM-dependent methyltransferase
MILHTKCPLCSSAGIAPFLECADHFLTEEKFELARCSDCGFVFTLNYPDEVEISRYYESPEYISHNDSTGGLAAKMYRFARKFMLKKKMRMVRMASGISKGSLLDIGSGTGHFLETMSKGGWSTKGIEINWNAREYSKSEFGLDVISPDEISSLPPASFDVITLWHVLEHFQDPFGYASEISRLLKPDGVCLIALPNCDSSDAIHYREFWAAYDVPRHLWHFTPESFGVFAERSGFKIKSLDSLPLDVFYISILSERYRNPKFHLIKGLFTGLRLSIRSAGKKKKASSLVYTIIKANQ